MENLQGNFYKDVYAMFDDKYMDKTDKECEYEIFTTIEKAHGRIEIWLNFHGKFVKTIAKIFNNIYNLKKYID